MLDIKIGQVYKDKRGEDIYIIDSDIINDKIQFVGKTNYGKKYYDINGICLSELECTSMYDLIEKCYITNPFLNSKIRLEKMLSNYKKYGTLVIGVDFDFTIKCPIEHFIYNDIVDFLKSIQNKEKRTTYFSW